MTNPLNRYRIMGAPTKSSLSEEDYRDGNNAFQWPSLAVASKNAVEQGA
jgi:hypothetical protein